MEDLSRRELVFESPFEQRPDQAWMCRYSLHHQDSAILGPDTTMQGLLRWRKLLPLAPGAPVPSAETHVVDQLSRHPIATECASLGRITVNHGLLYALPAIMTLPAKVDQGYCLPEDQTHSLAQHTLPGFRILPTQTNTQSLPARLRAAREDAPTACSFGPWGNPYRIEALKTIGLELACQEYKPTLVVWDPHGERTAALALVADYYLQTGGENPYRTILVQSRPFDALCHAFEGGNPDWGSYHDRQNQAHVPTPEGWIRWITDHLTQVGGTAIAVSSRNAEEACKEALKILCRTQFIDEEDHVLVWDQPG